MLFGAEVDCCSLKDGKVVPTESYVELKTSRIMDNQRAHRNFANYKLIKYWAQSYMAGVPTIVCGLRDDNGIVRRVETYKTHNIPRIARKENASWESSVCMNFCDAFLTWIKGVIADDDDYRSVYSFKYEEPFDCVKAEKLPFGSNLFLPAWFLEV